MKLISGIIHPLVMASYMSAILAYFMPEVYGGFAQDVVWRLVLAFAMMTALFPAMVVLGLWAWTPLVSDLELTDRKERLVPFLVLILFYSFTAYSLVFSLNLGHIVRLLLISAIVMVAIMVVINTRFKISIHSAAIWSLAGSCLGLAWKFPESGMMVAAYASIAAGGLIGTSRLYLGYHRPIEVWVGSMFGFFYSLSVAMFLI